MFVTYEAARASAALYNWRMGAYIAKLEIPDDAPITYDEPNYKGHVNIYGADLAFLQSCVVQIGHGPSVLEWT